MKAVLAVLALLSAAAGKPDAGAHRASDGGSHAALRRPVSIAADRMEIRDAQKEASWIGHIKVRRDATVITCDRMKALYTDTHEASRILCDGRVEAVDGDKRVRGDHADYDNEAGILVMTCDAPHPDGGQTHTEIGKPNSSRDAGSCFVEIWNGNTHAWGTQATFWSGEDRMELVGKVRTEIDDKQLNKDGGR